MADLNENGIPDSSEITFHIKSAVIGGIISLLIGGTSLTIAVSAFPDSSMVRAVAKAFAGGVCDPIKTTLNHCEKAVVCYQSGGDSSSCITFLD